MNASIHAHRLRFSLRILPVALALAVLAAACASSQPLSEAPASSAGTTMQVDETAIVTGVPDQGQDPAVIALDIGGTELCSGTLIAPDIVLTARHCVSFTSAAITCPSTAPQITGDRPPSAFHVLVGDDVATAKQVANGKQVFTPTSNEICDEDIALILLDSEVPGIQPLDVSATGITTGDHVTAIGYGRRGDGDAAGKKLLREHVAVLDTSAAEFLVGEATCQGDSGGPALDETTGEIVGVVSRGGPTCDGAGVHNIYTRSDAFLALIDQALASSASAGKKVKVDGGAKVVHDPVGGACKEASDCASGICATANGKTYCSRTCDTKDRCPAHSHCTATPSDSADGGVAKVCIETVTDAAP
jgi:secreted trypsin-like serine protease